MAITLFGSASTPADNGTNATGPVAITPPASMATGDLVVVEVAEDTSGKTLSVSDAGGQSWTDAGGRNDGTGSWRTFWCVFDGTWDANPAFTASGAISCLSAVMHVFRGGGSGYTWQEDVAYDSDTYSAQVVTRAGLVTVGTDVAVLAGWDTVFSRTWSSLSGSGWAVAGSAQYRNTSGTDLTATYAYFVSTSPGSTGDVTNTANTSHPGHAWIMAWANVVIPPPEIDIDTASVGFSGTAVSLERGRKVSALGDSFGVGPTAVSLERGRKIVAASEAFAVTGAAVGLRHGREVEAAAGSVSVSGQSASLFVGREIFAEAAAFSITGTATALEFGRELAAGATSFAIAGSDATFVYEPAVGILIFAEPRAFSISGTAISVRHGRELAGELAEYDFSGEAVAVMYGRELGAEPAGFGFSGADVGVQKWAVPSDPLTRIDRRKPASRFNDRRFNQGGSIPLRK